MEIGLRFGRFVLDDVDDKAKEFGIGTVAATYSKRCNVFYGL
jgi:hypothetical protein